MEQAIIGLEKVSWKTMKLWWEVNRKYGDHFYTLGVDGCGEVILAEGYTDEIARGNANVQKALRELLSL